ncbi:hypothetical protein N656DRAFT_200798 [Canariomyces notabilis]|uniref:Uncharacterized protein n=1 Tax=Canariomyces notabilis TaxID=2074819 RepID=A0AAN6TA20_9PEZI|nr:hypothetical protein N656DRAFT_200798 [Canariomyces arenarius]
MYISQSTGFGCLLCCKLETTSSHRCFWQLPYRCSAPHVLQSLAAAVDEDEREKIPHIGSETNVGGDSGHTPGVTSKGE